MTTAQTTPPKSVSVSQRTTPYSVLPLTHSVSEKMTVPEIPVSVGLDKKLVTMQQMNKSLVQGNLVTSTNLQRSVMNSSILSEVKMHPKQNVDHSFPLTCNPTTSVTVLTKLKHISAATAVAKSPVKYVINSVPTKIIPTYVDDHGCLLVQSTGNHLAPLNMVPLTSIRANSLQNNLYIRKTVSVSNTRPKKSCIKNEVLAHASKLINIAPQPPRQNSLVNITQSSLVISLAQPTHNYVSLTTSTNSTMPLKIVRPLSAPLIGANACQISSSVNGPGKMVKTNSYSIAIPVAVKNISSANPTKIINNSLQTQAHVINNPPQRQDRIASSYPQIPTHVKGTPSSVIKQNSLSEALAIVPGSSQDCLSSTLQHSFCCFERSKFLFAHSTQST